jgi:hypothetical protein
MIFDSFLIFLVGLFVGAFIGIFIMAILAMGRAE